MGSRQREIDDLIENIEETDNKIARMDEQAKGACCPDCYWGKARSELLTKQTNRVGWLKVLAEKHNIHVPKLRMWTSDYLTDHMILLAKQDNEK